MAPQPLSNRLRAYIAIHVGALAPAWIAVFTLLPPPDQPALAAALVVVAAAAGTWRIQLTTEGGRQSLAFAVISLALLLQGVQVAVLAAVVGALASDVLRRQGRWRWSLVFSPLYRRVFNLAHCGLVSAVAGLVWTAAVGTSVQGPAEKLAGLVIFTTVYFLLNTLGVATAIGLDRQVSPLVVWREHVFWTGAAYLLSAGAAALIWGAYQAVGPLSLALLPCLYLVYRAHFAYIEALKAQRELADQVQQLLRQEEDANRRKDEFLATLAHELRNPLAAISNAHYVLEQPGGLTGAPRYLDVIGRQSRHLCRLVEDLLDVSRITRGVVELRPETIDLRDPLRAALEAAQPAIRDRRHLLNLCVSDRPLPARVDADRVEQVFANLLGNAAKYTDPEGRIDVTLEAEGEAAVLRVRDTGIGIDPETLPKVFDLFVQADRSLAHSSGGLGIGLTLVRQLVELHGGTISARSEGRGQGSEFTVRLPLLPAGTPVRQRGASPPGAAAAPAAARPPGRPKVLLVEDNADAAETLAEMLELWGYDVALALNGPAALELYPAELPDVAILDVGLPEMDGYEVARRLRGMGARLPLIALTGYGRSEERETALGSGFDHHLVKPADPDQLRALLRSLLSQTASAREVSTAGRA
ncbi:MAG: ATP-binding protein [Armatimonadota bacterium]